MLKHFPVHIMFLLLTIYTLHALADDGDTTVVSVFNENGIHWGEVTEFQNDTVKAYFGGRIIERSLTLPDFDNPVHIYANLEVIPDDGGEPCSADPWDKAGYITLHVPFQQPVELLKFITGYGGHTYHMQDVSDLAPLLRGNVTIQAFIDTWLSPAWKVTFDLEFVEDTGYENPAWALSVYNNQQLMREDVTSTEPSINVDIPAGLDSFNLAYFTSGHSHIGSGGDEFVTKSNVIYVDETEIFRQSPWRSNCSNFADVNPCGNYPPSRSGWCPGDEVHPYRINLSSELSPGLHSIRHSVENIRTTHGYWRISSYLAGWSSGESIIPSQIGLEALEGTELYVDEVRHGVICR
jgi:hypothetical protein